MARKAHRPHITANAESPIAALRITLGLTQPQFAAILGCTRESLGKWETGTTAPGKPLLLLLGILRDHPELLTTAPLEIPEKAPQA